MAHGGENHENVAHSCHVTKIKDIKGIPGKYKRVLEAWAAFANHDGTNIFASKESVAAKAGISKWTVFRNTDDLVAASVLQEAQSRTGHLRYFGRRDR